MDIFWNCTFTGLLIGHREKVKFHMVLRDKFTHKKGRFHGKFVGIYGPKFAGKQLVKMANFMGIFRANFAGKRLILH